MTEDLFEALDAYFRAVVDAKIASMQGVYGLRETIETKWRREEVLKRLGASRHD